jgi:hypothetical protein
VALSRKDVAERAAVRTVLDALVDIGAAAAGRSLPTDDEPDGRPT